MFINDNCVGFDEYRSSLLAENYFDLCLKACDCNGKCIEEFAEKFNKEINAVLIFSEREISQQTAIELKNLSLITGKHGKTSSGIIALKEKNNTHGLFDMGVRPNTGVGTQDIMNSVFRANLMAKWGVKSVPEAIDECFTDRFYRGDFQNLIIFGEDPIGTSLGDKDVAKAFLKAEFVVVQDAFMTETAKKADLILPASFWFESGGSFTNTQRMIQEFEPAIKSKLERSSIEQLLDLLKAFGLNGMKDLLDVRAEIFTLLPKVKSDKHKFVATNEKINRSIFNHGCDYFMAEFDREFER